MTLPSTTEILAVLKRNPAGMTAFDIAAEFIASDRAIVNRSLSSADALDHVIFMLRLLEAQGRARGERCEAGELRVWTMAAAAAERGNDVLHAGQDVAAEGEDHGNPSEPDSPGARDAKPEGINEDAGSGFEWMIVEIFGHRRHVGRAREEDRFGAKMLRIDVPTVERVVDGSAMELRARAWTTHWYGGGALFSATLTDERSALKANLRHLALEPHRLTVRDDETEFSYS